jgi:glucokinase
VLAVDLGGTRIKAGQVHDGVVTDLVAITHGSATLARALERLEPLLAQGPVGVCLPGLISDDGEIVALPGKLDGAAGFDLRGWLSARTGGPVTIVNDAIAYGVGEALPGRTVVMTIGTGIGVAVVEDGRPLGRGVLGGGQLSGQLYLSEDGPPNSAGRAGTIEGWCRAERIVDEAREAGADVDDVPGVFAAAAAGDASALAGLAAYRARLAKAIGSLCLAHGPDKVVIGGGPVQPDGLLLQGLQELVEPYLWPGQQVAVHPARHGDAAALVGLEVLSRER